MASKDEQIPFTVGDQENIRVTKVLVEEMSKKLDKVADVREEVTALDTRTCSLETTRKRVITAAVAVLVTVCAGLLVWGLKGLIAGALVAGAVGAVIP
ncbi:MAG: hypothetical protein PVI03_03565 [Candidatus Thorarchaeota archaeon]|jgi:hypothetical protein